MDQEKRRRERPEDNADERLISNFKLQMDQSYSVRNLKSEIFHLLFFIRVPPRHLRTVPSDRSCPSCSSCQDPPLPVPPTPIIVSAPASSGGALASSHSV